MGTSISNWSSFFPPWKQQFWGTGYACGGMGPWLAKRQAGETPSQLAEEGGDGDGAGVGSWDSWPDVAR